MMNLKKNQFLRCLLLFFFIFLASRALSNAQETKKISAEDLQQVVELLENPHRREGFIKDLKKVIHAKEVTEKARPEKKERKLLVIESLFGKFEKVSKKIIDSGTSTISLLAQMPRAMQNAKTFLAQSENRAKLLRLLIAIASGIIIALIFRRLLKKLMPQPTERTKSLTSKLTVGVIRAILSLLPYGALLISFFPLFRALPSFTIGYSLVFLFFTVLFFYRVAIEFFRIFLSPDEERTRTLPLSNENAQYFWIWMLRFINYTAFYFLVVKTMLLVQMVPSSFSFIRTLLLLVFPFMISIFVLQIARDIRTKYESSQRNDEGSENDGKDIMAPVIRYWSVPAIGYCWAIFLFLIVHYEKGFHYLFKATLKTGFAILALFLALKVLDKLFARLFAVNERVKEKFPGLEEKTNRYILMVRRVFGWIIKAMALGIIGQAWGIPVAAFVASQTGALIITRAIAIIITIGMVIAIIGTCQFVCDHLLKGKKGKNKKEASQKMKTLVPMIRTTINIAAGFIGGIVILDRIGVNTTPILAGAGIVGLAIGFGSQTLVKDLINGLFILFEESIRVGDYVAVGSDEGIVEAVGLRTVKLRDVSGNVHVVPNSSVNSVMNYSKEFSRTVLDVGVAYREDVDEVMDIIKVIGEEMQKAPEYGKNILEPIEVFGLQKFDDSAIVIRARLTTKPLKQWGLKREFNRRIKKIFDQRGIEIPFPHRTIYMGEPKRGSAPPLNIQHKRNGNKENELNT
ncbi:MAG: mechanosensitive ion channel family protein [Pseudomonadota bacterium]